MAEVDSLALLRIRSTSVELELAPNGLEEDQGGRSKRLELEDAD
jgi:hypothetical protein